MDLIYEGITTQEPSGSHSDDSRQNGPDLRRDYDQKLSFFLDNNEIHVRMDLIYEGITTAQSLLFLERPPSEWT